ncbi:hypothetical protein ELI00_15535 [Rhizobium ruizarguesonis]|uniref:hypothetical protein n=1 Tax=Rhizobium ruizarguesonis TaxID=2081791 RepID=UPI0010312F4A|nr:hypothetical protein [Rhizobium ruizarguesonis]TAX77539.1 hypothetical protein ELI00_15535 [Rhizobium ruizarguesonis]
MTEQKRIYHLNMNPLGFAVSEEDATEACSRWPDVWKNRPWTDADKKAVVDASLADYEARLAFHDKINSH